MSSENPVLLLAYKLGGISSSSASSAGNRTASKSADKNEAWHLSLYVFDSEYSYGIDGITIGPMTTQPHETKPVGYTRKSKKQLEDYISKVKNDWSPFTYDLLTHNCQHFAKMILKFLGIKKSIPDKYTDLPNTYCAVLGPLKGLPGSVSRSIKSSSGSLGSLQGSSS